MDSYRSDLLDLLLTLVDRLPRDPLAVLEVGAVPPAYRREYRTSARGSVVESLLIQRGTPARAYRIVDRDPTTEPDLVWDLERPPAQGVEAELVVCSEVLEHCQRPEVVLRNLAACLRPGGRLLVTVPFVFDCHEPAPDLWRWTPAGLRTLVSRAGFEPIAEAQTPGSRSVGLLAVLTRPGEGWQASAATARAYEILDSFGPGS